MRLGGVCETRKTVTGCRRRVIIIGDSVMTAAHGPHNFQRRSGHAPYVRQVIVPGELGERRQHAIVLVHVQEVLEHHPILTVSIWRVALRHRMSAFNYNVLRAFSVSARVFFLFESPPPTLLTENGQQQSDFESGLNGRTLVWWHRDFDVVSRTNVYGERTRRDITSPTIQRP